VSERHADSLTQHTRTVWESRAGRELSDEDCREIQQNVFGFLQVLRDWAKSDAAAQQASGTESNTTHIHQQDNNT
jgi:hypothetical protein